MDIVGLGIFLMIMATAFFFFLRKAEYVTLTLRVSQSDLLELNGAPLWYLENLKPGTEQKDLFGRSVISLIKTYSYPTNSENRVLYINIKVLCTYNKRTGSYSYEGVPLLVGSSQSFKLNGVLIRGIIHSIKGQNQKRDKRVFFIEGFLNPTLTDNQEPYAAETVTDGIKNYLADKFVKGLKIKDSDGREVVSVEEVSVLPAKRKFIYGDRWFEVADREKKVVKLKIKLEAEKFGDVYLFKENAPIRINGNIYLDFWDFGAMMTITDFKEI